MKKKTQRNLTHDYVKLHETDKKGLTLCATKKRCETLKACLATALKKSEDVILSNALEKSYELKLSDIVFKGTTSKTENCITSLQISNCLEKAWIIRQQIKDKVNMLYIEFLNELQDLHTSKPYISLPVPSRNFLSYINFPHVGSYSTVICFFCNF